MFTVARHHKDWSNGKRFQTDRSSFFLFSNVVVNI